MSYPISGSSQIFDVLHCGNSAQHLICSWVAGSIHGESREGSLGRSKENILGMKGWKLTYGGNARGLEGYTDADGSTQEHQCAILGYTFLMNGGMISWSSKKQELITLSTAESEYVAATHAAKEVLWLCWLIGEIYQPLTHLIPLYSDLHSVITLTQDGSYHTCTKHIDIRYHFIRFIIQNGSINLIYCPTNNMAADMLTKLLLNIKAKHFAQSLGLQPS